MGEIVELRKGGFSPAELIRQHKADARRANRQNRKKMEEFAKLSYVEHVKYWRKRGIRI